MGSRRWLTVLAGTALVASLSAPPSGAVVKRGDTFRRAPAPKFVPGEAIVHFTTGTTAPERGSARNRAGVAFERSTRISQAQVVKVKGSVRAAVERLARQPDVLSAQPNYLYRALAPPPDDTRFAELWGLHNTGQAIPGAGTGVNGVDVSALDAWDTAHLIGVAPGRDFAFEELDVRTVEAGDTAPGGGTIEIEPAIEVGNIFKLGTRYSEPLGATYLDESGAERAIVMGSYGIGPARIVAAAIEQNADDKGIVWPMPLAPWQVELVGLGKAGDETMEAAEKLYEELGAAGLDVLFDDRDAGPGEKLTDAELIGCPVRVVVGKRALAEGQVEAQERASGADHRFELADVPARVRGLLEGA